MTEHEFDSPTHGLLHARVEPLDPPVHDRHWRAVLDPRPARLKHLVSVEGITVAEALEVMASAVERYASDPVAQRSAAHP